MRPRIEIAGKEYGFEKMRFDNPKGKKLPGQVGGKDYYLPEQAIYIRYEDGKRTEIGFSPTNPLING